MTYAIAFLTCVLLVSAGVAQEPLAFGTQKQLFMDDYVVAEMVNVARELGQVVKANDGEPVFTGGRFYGTVIHDDGLFKMWFRKSENAHYGYAESRDGLHFQEKADIEGINFAGDVNLSVTLDRHETEPAHRFKAGYDAPGMAMGIAHSADGIHWTPYNDGNPVTYRAADTYNQIVWDPISNVYRLFTRTDFGGGGGPKAGTVAPKFEVRGTRSMTNPDVKANPTEWEHVRHWLFDREGPEEYLRRQVYAVCLWVYEGVYFAILSVYEYPGDVSEGTTTDLVTRHERDVMNYYIATSRDADSWDLRWVYAGEPLVPRGPAGAFDKDLIMPSSTIITHGDKHWIYYGGANERHGTAETDPPVWFDRTHAIGLATLRLDGFVGLRAGEKEGVVLTKPFRLEGDALELNVAAPEGAIAVEVLDADGSPVPGLSGENAAQHERVDDIRLRVNWGDSEALKVLRGDVVRLRLKLRNATLYAFQVRQAEVS